MELHRAGKEYLKTILVLEQQNGVVRSLDVAKTLHVTKPSVCKAMKHLREGGYLTMDANKRIRLTGSGREIAEQGIHAHRSLASCLISMGVDPAVAERDARQMEHAISPETLEQMRLFVEARPQKTAPDDQDKPDRRTAGAVKARFSDRP